MSVPGADLSCRQLVELVTDYLEGRMPPEERARFEIHLVYCRGCDYYVEQMRGTLKLLGRLSEDAIEPVAKDALLAAFRDWNRTRGASA